MFTEVIAATIQKKYEQIVSYFNEVNLRAWVAAKALI